VVTDTDAPTTPALDAWYESHPYRDRTDHPRTHLWFPHDAPSASLQVMERGCNRPAILHDPAKPMVNVNLGGCLQVGGYLSEMEAYFAAVMDALRFARWQADEIAARMAEEEAS
jgi:hypothetical protein